MKVSPFALLLAMSSSARGSSKSAKSLANEPDVILEENALSISLSSYPESVVVVDAEIAAKSSKSTKKRLFESKSSKSNRRNLTTKSEKGFSYGVDVTGLGLGDAMSYNVEATLPDGMGYLVDSTAPEVLLESLSYVTTVIEASSKSSKKSKLNNMVSLAKSTKAETAVSKNSGKSTKSSATDATSLIEPRSIGPANFSPVDFTRIVDVDQSDPAIEDASSGALAAAQITQVNKPWTVLNAAKDRRTPLSVCPSGDFRQATMVPTPQHVMRARSLNCPRPSITPSPANTSPLTRCIRAEITAGPLSRER
ncbi:hypothetical protein THAOC_27044 [Thalassiosira oceanica]|uniref:Uncharacterized protein n=1 Tax=Thalassiosira oceanica TaxID=159749 RepID=K0RIG4_THAOC|nr:hypothetical protein THAOC_27044 [Thalassiosira oceanica]|eukprot:EJK53508.1 hypothetical protein THAOC_27044 [Thalassiosira oceanica]